MICTGEVYGIKLNMYKIWKQNQLMSFTLLCSEISLGKDVCYKHSHTLEYVDTIKINHKVKNTMAT